MNRLLPLLFLAICLSVGRADGGARVVQQFEGYDSETTTATFTVADNWEIIWLSGPPTNITILSFDRQVVAGANLTFRGSICIPKGGTYYVQINRQHPEMKIHWKLVVAQVGDGSPLPDDNSMMANRSDPSYKLPTNILDPGTVSPSPASSSGAPQGANSSSFGAPPMAWNGSPSRPPNTVTPAPSAGPATAAGSQQATPVPAPEPALPPVNLSQDQARAVVLIKGDNGEGTGFLVKTKDGPVVITNQHVLANNPNIKLTTSNGNTIVPLAFKAATERDLAMITIKDVGYSYLTLASDVTAVSPGDQVVTPGNSEGGEVMLNTNGRVLAIGPDRIEIDNPIYHGNSGGPVFDTKTNQIIGVVTEAMKVDTSDDLDKASFSSRNSAIRNAMRYFALRVDNVPQWEELDWRSFQSETAFLDKFDQRSRCLDSFLNSPSPGNNSSQDGNGQQQSSDQDSHDANLWRQDTVLVRANEQFEDRSGGNSDTGQKLDALREMLGSIVDAANTDVTTIKNLNNFYSYDRQRAKEEMDYRQAIKDELDNIGNNIDRLGRLPRTNN